LETGKSRTFNKKKEGLKGDSSTQILIGPKSRRKIEELKNKLKQHVDIKEK
jgi:hypothetical protein